MIKQKTIFLCQVCGYQSPKWLGRCPDCNSWSSLVEETVSVSQKTKERTTFYKEEPLLLKEVRSISKERIITGISELDRVLGGGLVCGSVILIGGEPGIGKSTLSLQISFALANQNKKVLYVSGEESANQTKLRAERLGCIPQDNLYIVNQTDLSLIREYIERLKPDIVIVDSIQVIFEPTLSSSPGSVSQVRECSGILTQIAKSKSCIMFIIGHVTKEGTLAGPRVLEHIVDTVLYFEGERFSTFRILRAVKNRFGSTNEIGVFEMTQEGLKQIKSPSQIFLSERSENICGSAVVSVLEGTRPLLVEIQALVSRSGFAYSRRRTQGFDYNRLHLLVAVLEKRLGLGLETQDIFISVVGGINIVDPSADLGVCLAIISAFKDRPILDRTVVFGEVDLTGKLRSVFQPEARLKEAEKLGFKKCILPKLNLASLSSKCKTLELMGVSDLKEALELVL